MQCPFIPTEVYPVSLDPQQHRSPGRSPLPVPNHLYFVQDCHLVLLPEIGGLDCAAGQVGVLVVFLLAGHQVALAQLLLPLPSQQSQRGHVDALLVGGQGF